MSNTSVGQIGLDLVVNKKQFEKQMIGINRIAKKAGAALASAFAVKKIVDFGKACLDLGSDLQEVQNVVDVTFPSMKVQVDEFAKSALDSFGLSETMAKKFTGTFGAMAKSFGFTEKQAYDMSATLTGLAGDVASFYNITQDEAYTKLKSVFTGETESLKDLGVTMTQSALDAFALANGFGKTTKKMSEAEKVALRYHFIQEQLSVAAGDFARNSNSWANQVRILSQQLGQLMAAIGQGLINVLTPVVKMLNIILGKLQAVADSFKSLTANLMGIDTSDATSAVATDLSEAASSSEDLTSGLNSAAKAAKSLAGFDDIQKLSDTSADSSVGSASIDFGAWAQGETIFEKTENQIQEVDERAKKMLQNIAKYAGVAASALGGMKLGSFLSDLVTANIEVKSLKDAISLFGKKLAITGGITLAITGIALEGAGIYEAITEGLDMYSLGEILLGGSGLAGGLSIAMSKLLPSVTLFGHEIAGSLLGGAIGGIAAGIPMFITGIYDSLVNGIDWMSAALTAIGSTAAGAGVGAIIGSLGGPIGAGIGALIGLAVGLITDFSIWLVQNWDAISAKAKEAWGFVKNVFQQFDTFLTTVFTIDWSKNFGVLGDVLNGFMGFASDIWNSIKLTFQGITEFLSGAFTGNWSKAWTGIKNIFAGIFSSLVAIAKRPINSIISIINGMIRGIVAGVNSVIQAINSISFDMPSWLGGGHVGFSLRTFSAPQIPYLANGGYVKANTPQLAMIGDNRHQGEVVAPEGKMQEMADSAAMKALAAMEDYISAMMAGFEAVVQAIKEKDMNVTVGDEDIGKAADRYRSKMAVITGGT